MAKRQNRFLSAFSSWSLLEKRAEKSRLKGVSILAITQILPKKISSLEELFQRFSTGMRSLVSSAMQLIITPVKKSISSDEVFSNPRKMKKAMAGAAAPRKKMEAREAWKLNLKKPPALSGFIGDSRRLLKAA